MYPEIRPIDVVVTGTKKGRNFFDVSFLRREDNLRIDEALYLDARTPRAGAWA